MEEVETWKPVVGFDGYEVSDLGRVRSWRKGGNGYLTRLKVARVLKPWPDGDGYLSVYLCQGGGIRTARKVYRLVMEAFVGPRPEGHECAHEDGSRTNNRLDNLKWKTHTENERDKAVHGTLTFGERNGVCKLTVEKVADIRASSESDREAAERLGMSTAQIGRIRRGERWAHTYSAAVVPSGICNE